MFELRSTRIGFLWILIFALGLTAKSRAQDITTLSCIVIEGSNGSYNLFVEETTVVGPMGPIPETNAYQGPLLSITNRGTNVPFQTVAQSSFLGIYEVSPSTPIDSIGETFTFFDGNIATNIYVPLGPVFLTQPQSQSLFVGSNGSFTAQAAHCTGYQWQMDGTNLIDDGHFSGVTNATLNLTSLSTNDAGTYTVIAENPSLSETSTNAILDVFKPILLAIPASAPPGVLRILAGNADQSPFEAPRVANVNFYFTTDLSVGSTNWVLCTNSILLTNGLLQCDFATDGIVSGFWRVVVQP
jgi:hypothetical protein